MLGLIGGAGLVSTVLMLGLMFYALGDGAAAITPYAMTMVFTGFVFLEYEKHYVIRWLRETPTFSTSWLALQDWGIIGGVLLLGLPVYLAVALAIRRLFRVEERDTT